MLSEALWESAKTDLKFFAPIQVFIKKLSKTDFCNPENLGDIKLYIEKIEEFLNRYRPTPGGGLYITPNQTSGNDTTVKAIYNLVQQLSSLPKEQ